MPLLNKKPLERIPLPQNLSPNDPVYYCEATDEIFCTYDDFFDRLMELNSTVWTCEFTNRSGLTYFEAQESEQEALKALESFPESLEVPILWLVQNASCRGRFEDLLNDIYAFLKDRYFIGEEVVIGDGSARKVASIVSLTCIRDDWEPDDSKSKEVQTPPVDWYNYTARVQGGPYEEDYEIDNLVFVMLSRNKRIVARNNLKLFLKNTCFVKNNERYEVKDRFRELHQLDDRKWTDFFGGPEAVFPRTPMLARGRAAAKAKIDVTGDYLKFEDDEFGGQAAPLCTFVPKTPKAPRTPKPRGRPPKTPKDGTPKTPSARDISASPTKKKALSEKRKAEILAQQTELFVTFEKARRIGIENVGYWQQEDRLLTKREIDQLNELLKEARKKEREAHQKKKEAAQNWARKRDDLECDDLQRMPDYPAVPLPDWLSPDQFAEVLDVLQFFNSFSELLPVKELRGTTRVSLSDIVIAIRCSDPNNSSFASLMQILLQARADVCDEEEGDEADFSRRDELVLEQNPDYEHPEHGEAVREMTALHEEIRYTLGSAVRNLSCDWLTITEVLRLMILTSGYVTRPAKHRHRLFQRGSIRFYEDPAYLFRIGNPELVEKLAVGTVFDLQPAERLQLMHVIMQQLLTYAKFRNFAAERAEDLVTQRKELKKLRCWDTSQESDAKEARLLREMESDGTADVPERPKPTKETIKLKGLLKAAQEGKRHDQGELQRILLEGVVWNELELEEIVFAREMQKRHVQEGMDQLRSGIFELTTVYGSSSLGRDRAFRNYIIVDQVPILLVENPQELDRIGSCIEQTECKDRGDLESEDSWRDSVLACSGNVGTCIVHGPRAQQRTRWCYIESPEQLEQVLSCCNPRGFREIDLSSEIDYLKPEIVELLDKTYNKSRNGSLSQYFMERADDPALLDNKMDWLHEVIELILELESKMTEGFLGRLPSNINRDEWRKMLGTTGDVTPLIQDDITCDIKQREVLHSKDDFHKLTPIEKVGIAFLQVVQAVNVKFIKKPFTRVGPGSVIEPTWTLIHWQRSVVKCRSVPSLALHLYSIEPAIQWEKSKLQAKCRVCRKKGDADNLVLCIECEKCYHLGCAKPRLTEVVSPWTCHDCRKEDEKEEKLNGQANGDVSMDIEANNENESNNSSDKSKEDILRTSSGRKVKRAEYNIDRLTSLAPPPKKKVAVDREVSVANSTFSNGKEGSHNGEVTADEDEEAITSRSEENGDYDYSDSESTPRAVKRRSVLNRSALETSATSGRLSIGLRDADPNFKEKMKKLHDVVKSATRQEFAWPFLAPVDVNEVPDYLEIIKRPMDLGTMINKFSNHFYDNADQVRKDADLIVSNCKTYNEEDSEIYECAMQLADYWENNLNPVFKTENGRKRRR